MYVMKAGVISWAIAVHCLKDDCCNFLTDTLTP